MENLEKTDDFIIVISSQGKDKEIESLENLWKVLSWVFFFFSHDPL